LCLACILFEGCPSKQKKATKEQSAAVLEALQSLVSWIAARLQSSTTTSLSLVTPALSVLINAPEARKLFDQAGGIGFLVRHLRVRQTGPKANAASVQHLYELCFCLWIMTYECSSSEEMRSHFHRDQAVFALVVSYRTKEHSSHRPTTDKCNAKNEIVLDRTHIHGLCIVSPGIGPGGGSTQRKGCPCCLVFVEELGHV